MGEQEVETAECSGVEGRNDLVELHVEREVSLIRSELFDLAAHIDLPERNASLRGHFTESHYRRIAEALESSSTIMELNAGRIHDEYGDFHPSSTFVDVLQEYNVAIAPGSDAHSPDELVERSGEIERRLDGSISKQGASSVNRSDPLLVSEVVLCFVTLGHHISIHDSVPPAVKLPPSRNRPKTTCRSPA